MYYIIIIALLFIAGLLYFRITDQCNIIDKPNQRRSHTSITLRGGGIIFYLGAWIFFLASGGVYQWFLLGLTMITIIRLVDDIKPISQLLRLAVQVWGRVLRCYQWGV